MLSWGEILNVEHWKLNLDFKQPQSELRNSQKWLYYIANSVEEKFFLKNFTHTN